MPARSHDANIGRMPISIGLPFSLMVAFGIITLVSVMGFVALLLLVGAGLYLLWVLALPATVYAVFFIIAKKYGEFYALQMGKVRIARIKTWVWLHETEDKILLNEIKKKIENGK